jgi:hypothetical protein
VRVRVRVLIVTLFVFAFLVLTPSRSNLMEFRAKYKDDVLKKTGVKLGFMSAFAKAAVHALKEQPVVNACALSLWLVYLLLCLRERDHCGGFCLFW